MLWLFMITMCGTAIAFRIRSLTGRPATWWWTLTASLAFIMVGAAFLIDQQLINEMLGQPNIAIVLSNSAFVLAGGASQMYNHYLRHEDPSPRWMLAHAVTAAAMLIIVVSAWAAAPIHETFTATTPFHREALIYEGGLQLYMGFVGVNVALCTARLQRRTLARDPARKAGLSLVCAGAIIDVLAQGLLLVWLGLRALQSPATPLARQIAEITLLIAILCIALGLVVFLLAPTVFARLHARHLIVSLTPLWRRVLELQPTAALPSAPMRTSLHVERIIIETIDGLDRILVSAHVDTSDPYRAAAITLVSPASQHGPSITRVLPQLATRHDEEEILMQLTRTYVETRKDVLSHAPQTASSHRSS